MFNDNFTIGEFSESSPASRWGEYLDEAIWKRIEAYVVWRWGQRQVEWVVHGEGLFVPPLKPTTITTVERFGSDWEPYQPARTPFGIELPEGYFRLQGIAGLNVEPPADVLQAYTRLVEYLDGIREEGHVGAVNVTDSLPGVSLSVRRPAQALARALEYSGAADLLKAYRYV